MIQTSFKDRSDYFKNIAFLNKQVAHDQFIGEGPAKRNSFHRINDEDELNAAVVDWAHFPCVVHTGMTIIPSQPGKGVYRKTNINQLFFLSRFDAQSGIADAVQNAWDEAYDIASQFLSYLVEDQEANMSCGGLFGFDLNNSKLEMIGPINDNLAGWSLIFQDIARAIEYKYNTDNWLDI